MKLGAPILERLCRYLATLCPPETLRIDEVELFFGPNPYSVEPAIVCHLAVGGSFPLPAATVGALARTLAGLVTNAGQEAIPFEDPATLQGAEALAGWAARLAAALMQHWIGLPYDGGACSQPDAGDRISLRIALHDDAMALAALRVALTSTAMLLAGSPDAAAGLRSDLAAMRQLCTHRQPSPETRLMIAAARADTIPVLPVSGSPSMRQFGWGIRSELFWVTSSNQDGMVGSRISRLKDYQKKLFEELGLPTPRWRQLLSQTDIASALRHVGFPCVVKPVDHDSGRGVTANITSLEMLNEALAVARRLSPQLLLEAHEPGHDHRLMIINGTLEMAMRLDPPTVRGDGRRTVSDLVAELNRQRADDQRPGAPAQVPVDDYFALALMSQQLTATSIPDEGREILLRTNANRGTGGIFSNVLHSVHPDIRRYAELLAEAAGFRTVGIDYVTPDIGKSHAEVGGGFLEINGTPGMARAVAAGFAPAEVPRLLLGSRPGRVPVVLLVAPADRLDEAAKELVAEPRESTAIASSTWSRLGPVTLPAGNLRAIDRVTALLRYRSVTSLQILWTPEDLCKWGLPVDSPDCVALLDASLDQPWSEVVEERAGEVLNVRTVAEAVRLLKRRAKAAELTASS